MSLSAVHVGNSGSRSVIVNEIYEGPELPEVFAIEIDDETGKVCELRFIFFSRQRPRKIYAAFWGKYVMKDFIHFLDRVLTKGRRKPYDQFLVDVSLTVKTPIKARNAFNG